MTNPLKGEITFESGDKTYTFKLGTNAQIMIENKVGMTLAQFFRDNSEKMGPGQIRTIFHAGLFRNHKMTEEEVGDLIDQMGMEHVAEIFTEAAIAAFPKVAEQMGLTNGSGEPPALPPKSAGQPTGKNS